MSTFPREQQSVAGGIFGTVIKMCTAVGLGISASIYNAESSTSIDSGGALQVGIKPYRSVWYFCVASAALGLLFVPFLTIKTQGHSETSSFESRDQPSPVLGEKEKPDIVDSDGDEDDNIDLPSKIVKE